eukprot:14368945-Alexandrium_andersonii.AAC.1
MHCSHSCRVWRKRIRVFLPGFELRICPRRAMQSLRVCTPEHAYLTPRVGRGVRARRMSPRSACE